jgi:hypothetical protein
MAASGRVMYDGIASDAKAIPTTTAFVAGYVDGHYAWSAADWARFPHSVHIGIAVRSTTNDGIVLDCEPGNATPAEAVDWVVMRRKAGVDPTVYCGQSSWPSVKAAFAHAGIAAPHWWVARYDDDPTIPAGAVAKQWKSTADWDESSVAAYWPGVDPAPASTAAPATPDTEEDEMKASVMAVNGIAMIGIAAGADTTVEIGADPGVIKAGTTWRVVALMAGKKPYEVAKGWTLDADGSGTGVVHVPADLVPVSRVLMAYCTDPSLPYVMYVQ